MKNKFQTRSLALAIIENGDKILAKKFFDDHKKETFYRVPGGGIEFRETSRDALRREMMEEFNAKIKNLKFLQVIENIFTYQGKGRHEIVFLYRADFVYKNFYNKEELIIMDDPTETFMNWFDKKELLKGNFYPEGVKDFV